MSGTVSNSSETGSGRTRIAYVVTHPIQYQAPLLRYFSQQADIDLTVFFQTDFSLRRFFDPAFGRWIEWGLQLLEGYRSEVLPAIGPKDRVSFLFPVNYGIVSRLRRDRFDLLWVHGYTRWFNWVAMLVARLRGIKILVRDDATAVSTQRSPIKKLIKRRLFFPLLNALADGILVTGSLNRAYFLENGFAPERIFPMPNTVDNDFFSELAKKAAARRAQFRAELGLAADRPVILFAGKFLALKRPLDLLDAFNTLLQQGPARPYLLFVGDGPLATALRDWAGAMGDDVRFLGFRNQAEMAACYDLCSVFVLPSQYESWGMAVNEAMAVGRPVIVSNRVGCSVDLVRNGVNGYVFPCGDVTALTKALASVLSSTQQSEKMGEASREIIDQWSFRQNLEGLRGAIACLRGGPAGRS